MFKKERSFLISSKKDILGGEPVFYGTRVPVKTLVDYLKAGDSLDDFLQDFPTVHRKQILQLLENTTKVLAQG